MAKLRFFVFLCRSPCQSRYQHWTSHVPRCSSLLTAIVSHPLGSPRREESPLEVLGAHPPCNDHIPAGLQLVVLRPEAFVCREAMTNLQAIHLLFGMEDQFGVAPTDSAGCTLDSNNPTIKKALRDWSKKHVELENGEISSEEYTDWKDTYNPSAVLN